MTTTAAAIDQVRTARLYTRDMLSHVATDLWFEQPSAGVTHVAWQVGHLAVAQYGLALKRVRGERPDDTALIPQDFRQAFGKSSTPDPNPANNPSVETIREIFDRVHEQTIRELNDLPEALFDEPADQPRHPMFETKRGAVLWCAQHEFIHIGQIALLRRLLGEAPLR